MPSKIYYEDRSALLGLTEAEAERKRFYNSRAWKALRAFQLRVEPLCRRCLAEGLVIEATTVHHVVERLTRPDLALSRSNLESLCASHHSTHHTTRRRIGEETSGDQHGIS